MVRGINSQLGCLRKSDGAGNGSNFISSQGNFSRLAYTRYEDPLMIRFSVALEQLY